MSGNKHSNANALVVEKAWGVRGNRVTAFNY
jgi:hypothetical protein